MLGLVGGGVPVPAEGAGAGETGAHFLLDALGACANVTEVGAAALAAHLGPVDAVAAVVAEEPAEGAVVDEGDLAAAAPDDVPAVAAVDGSRKAPPIDEEDDLLSGVEGPGHLCAEEPAEHIAVAGGKLLLHVDDVDPGQGGVLGALADAPGELQKFKLAGCGAVGGGHVGRGAS